MLQQVGTDSRGTKTYNWDASYIVYWRLFLKKRQRTSAKTDERLQKL